MLFYSCRGFPLTSTPTAQCPLRLAHICLLIAAGGKRVCAGCGSSLMQASPAKWRFLMMLGWHWLEPIESICAKLGQQNQRSHEIQTLNIHYKLLSILESICGIACQVDVDCCIYQYCREGGMICECQSADAAQAYESSSSIQHSLYLLCQIGTVQKASSSSTASLCRACCSIRVNVREQA